MRDFFASPEVQWPRQQRLHVYAVGTPELAELFEAYHRELVTSGVAAEHGLGLQGPEWAHFTVQMLLRACDELRPGQREALEAELSRAVASLPELTLRVGAARGASQRAVELAVEPGVDAEWMVMVTAVRRAVAGVLGEDALPELGSNASPHTSIGYGTGDGDSGAITSVLNKVRRPVVEVPVTAVHLVAVTQHPERGCFTWEHLAELPLRH
ncbi:2'-5' RNA ligase family protein [Saccharopolyspora sp. NPDC000359]|uniref:2'-5' RNA ligase family protein n=1 Tax=Saccharopolyspora sp. NPDC000359 TaxID=3154251 RepID=UPI0033292C5B